MVWYGMVWYGMVWYGMVWYGMVWYGIANNSYLWSGEKLPIALRGIIKALLKPFDVRNLHLSR